MGTSMDGYKESTIDHPAIKAAWAAKWNERASFSTRKVKLGHDYLCMAVLVQEIINADYPFVIHATNPSSGDLSDIYAKELLTIAKWVVLSPASMGVQKVLWIL